MKVRMGAEELVELGRKRCPPGKILRKSFSFIRDGKRVRVPSTCVVDRGAPGKTPPAQQWAREIPELRGAAIMPVLGRQDNGFLPGWNAADSPEKRMAAVKKNVAKDGCLVVSRKLVVIHNLNFRQNPSVAQKAMSDRDKAVGKDWCKLKGNGKGKGR